MPCPAIFTNLAKLTHNSKLVVESCQAAGLSVMAVTKAFCADPKTAQAIQAGGVTWFGDSRIQNIARLKEANLGLPLCLMRLPMLSEVDEVVRLADMSQVSEVITAKALSEAALKAGVRHKVTLMVDLGDLREGVWPRDVVAVAKEMAALPGIELHGIGVNLACYGGVIPTHEKLSELVNLAQAIREQAGVALPLVSGGNSANLHLLPNGMPKGITQLRVGEGILLGRETIAREPIPGANLDVFTLHTEIIELKEKPSVPIGKIGQDTFGNTPVFKDKGIRKRAIVAIGRQDLNVDCIDPLDAGAEIIGASSDHMIVDITDASPSLGIGSILKFNLQYAALMTGLMSPYVSKEYI